MKRSFAALTALVLVSAQAAAVGTSISYQGRLTDNGAPANGVYDFQIRLYEFSVGEPSTGPTLNFEDVMVTEGLYALDLDFLSNFNGSPRFLEVGVRPGASTNPHTILSPRRAINSSPHALVAGEAENLSLPFFGFENVNNYLMDLGNTGTGNGIRIQTAGNNKALETRASSGSVGVHSTALGGSTGKAGVFQNISATSVDPAVEVTHAGSGVGLLSVMNGNGTAIVGRAPGATGGGGKFEISDAGNANNALLVDNLGNGSAFLLRNQNTSGGGDGIRLTQSGLGDGADISLSKTTGTGHAVRATTDGLGNAGFFSVNNAANTNGALVGTTNGAGPGVSAINTSTLGPAMKADITSATSSFPALDVATAGTGGAAAFTNSLGTNGSAVVSATTIGTGSAGNFAINNTASSGDALTAGTNGVGAAIRAVASSVASKPAVLEVTNTSNSQRALSASTVGTGSAGHFLINRTSNSTAAVVGSTNGTNGIGVRGEGTNTTSTTSNKPIGVLGTTAAIAGTGVKGETTHASSIGIGVQGTASEVGSVGVEALNSTSTGMALRIRGGIQVPQGTSTNSKCAFVYDLNSGENVCDLIAGCIYTIIDHPLCNDDPNAMLFVMPRGSADLVSPGISSDTTTVHSVLYEPALGRWAIRHALININESKLNILIINQ